jgi:hypothetical protein
VSAELILHMSVWLDGFVARSVVVIGTIVMGRGG